MAAAKTCAEYYRGFLLYLLREKLKASGPYDIRTEGAVAGAGEGLSGNGIYFIFWSAYAEADILEKQDQIYPLYVGITGRTFRQRFLEHATNGVVSKINSAEWPGPGQPVKGLREVVAYVLNVDLPVAKFLESTFLSTFDFAMNKQENAAVRPGIDPLVTETVEAGAEIFARGYGYMKEGVAEADRRVANIREGGYNLEHYQLK